MLNPMSRAHQGYSQAHQSLFEVGETSGSEDGQEEDLEAGRTPRSASHRDGPETIPLWRSQKKHRGQAVLEDGAPDTQVLHPNIRREDKIHEHDSSDDEVPQSLMIETASHEATALKGKGRATGDNHDARRARPLHSVPGRKLPSQLPVTNENSARTISTPPKPSDTGDDADGGMTPRNSSPSSKSSNPLLSRPSKPMGGLDDYEKALWNWVNVYNLDAFLQEVYYYYEGKGIYSIALSRGLNLLLVTPLLCPSGEYNL